MSGYTITQAYGLWACRYIYLTATLYLVGSFLLVLVLEWNFPILQVIQKSLEILVERPKNTAKRNQLNKNYTSKAHAKKWQLPMIPSYFSIPISRKNSQWDLPKQRSFSKVQRKPRLQREKKKRGRPHEVASSTGTLPQHHRGGIPKLYELALPVQSLEIAAHAKIKRENLANSKRNRKLDSIMVHHSLQSSPQRATQKPEAETAAHVENTRSRATKRKPFTVCRAHHGKRAKESTNQSLIAAVLGRSPSHGDAPTPTELSTARREREREWPSQTTEARRRRQIDLSGKLTEFELGRAEIASGLRETQASCGPILQCNP